MVSQPLQTSRDILGYTLQERIGSGGFGEVWSAIAPGGLMKAIKIVYGYHDEKRAQAELKALDRMKEVRHPFMLSLERIEIFEGQLVVVSELADKSMAELFDEYIIKGEPGIPRDELLKYIRNAAEALDYLSDEHGLQHLDIKPENLLMVGSHVKVADFGLIKDLQNASQSLMNGMTPAYAAPELFDGRPGAKSDQYSLAIVYQEMLTSVRPFPGTTPAQLAAQHMHGKPNLRPLLPGDQPIIAKALSKDPSVRFESSVAMAEELLNRKRSVKKSIRRIQTIDRTPTDTESNTVMFDRADATALISSQGLPFQASEIEALDPPACDEADAKLQPALIIGVGGTAGRVIRQIKRQLISRHGSMEAIPSVRLMCIDTDRNDISQLSSSHDDSALSLAETLSTPLLKPEDYRERAGTSLSWLSRRWIYNIPRSLQTEALRPLGRLAFADHFETICNQVDDAIKQVTTPENLAQSSETLEMNPGDMQPRVFIVSSISGGVGSGMTLDLAYTVKLLLAEHGLKTDSVSGILMHSTYQRSRDPGLSAANAFAFMTELRHYVENGYPGDETLGLPEFEDETPFDFTYFNELENDLPQTAFEEKLSSIAEYICLSTTSKCSVFFDQCRKLEEEADHFSLRTFGVSVSGPGSSVKGFNAVNLLAQSLTKRWLNGDADSDFDAHQTVSDQITEFQLSTDDIIEQLTQQANDIIGDFNALANGASDIVLAGESDRLIHLQSYFDGALGCPVSRRDTSYQDPEVCLAMDEQARHQAISLGASIAKSILDLLNKSKLDLSLPRATTAEWKKQLTSSMDQLSRAILICEQHLQHQLAILADISVEKARSKSDERRKFEEGLGVFCQLRFEEFVLRSAKTYFRAIRNGFEVAESTVANYTTALSRVSGSFETWSDANLSLGTGNSFNLDDLLNDSVTSELEKHVDQMEIQVFESMVKDAGGYLAILNDGNSVQHYLPSEIRNAAQSILADAHKKVSLEKVIVKNNVGPEQLVKWLTEKVRLARPRVDDCGGSSRLMVGLPVLSGHSSLPEMFSRQFNLNVKAINGTRGTFVVCFEAENVALANVAYRLLQARPDAIELVKRIHTRNDVDWSTLSDLL